jgi:hypothetical protein
LVDVHTLVPILVFRASALLVFGVGWVCSGGESKGESDDGEAHDKKE